MQAIEAGGWPASFQSILFWTRQETCVLLYTYVLSYSLRLSRPKSIVNHVAFLAVFAEVSKSKLFLSVVHAKRWNKHAFHAVNKKKGKKKKNRKKKKKKPVLQPHEERSISNYSVFRKQCLFLSHEWLLDKFNISHAVNDRHGELHQSNMVTNLTFHAQDHSHLRPSAYVQGKKKSSRPASTFLVNTTSRDLHSPFWINRVGSIHSSTLDSGKSRSWRVSKWNLISN